VLPLAGGSDQSSIRRKENGSVKSKDTAGSGKNKKSRLLPKISFISK
jgi:hypothetical protein